MLLKSLQINAISACFELLDYSKSFKESSSEYWSLIKIHDRNIPIVFSLT